MLAVRTGLSPVMIGRAAELARLRELASATGDPAVALISGEAGIGKTRLVAELVATLDPAWPVLAGQGSQGAPGRPFQLLLEAVEPQVAAWDAVPERLADRSEPLRLLLAPVAPRLAGPAEREYGHEELLRAAVALVRELAGRQGALLVFEDLHWADAESIALFGRLAVTPWSSCWPSWSASGWSPPSPSTASAGPRWPSCWPPSTATRCRSRSPRRCTGAPGATRSSWRSWWSPPAGPTRRGWPTSRCPGT